jgi:hypothetical protein
MTMISGAATHRHPVARPGPDLEGLHQVIAAILNEHTNQAGRCAACPGVPFPCDLAVLAEHNAALL